MAEKASGLKDKIDYQAFFFYVKKKKILLTLPYNQVIIHYVLFAFWNLIPNVSFNLQQINTESFLCSRHSWGTKGTIENKTKKGSSSFLKERWEIKNQSANQKTIISDGNKG